MKFTFFVDIATFLAGFSRSVFVFKAGSGFKLLKWYSEFRPFRELYNSRLCNSRVKQVVCRLVKIPRNLKELKKFQLQKNFQTEVRNHRLLTVILLIKSTN